jgi:L,D-transpeptidase catalytic domain
MIERPTMLLGSAAVSSYLAPDRLTPSRARSDHTTKEGGWDPLRVSTFREIHRNGPENGYYRIKITLPFNRESAGQLTVETSTGFKLFGPIPVLGLADRKSARDNGNPSRNPLLKFGNTPTGQYRSEIYSSYARRPNGMTYADTKTGTGLLTYGTQGIIVLTPTGGQALEASKERSGLLIHAGDLRDGRMRPTHGCIRVSPADMAQLTGLLLELGEPIPMFASEGTVDIQNEIPAALDVSEDDPIDPAPSPADEGSDDKEGRQFFGNDIFLETAAWAEYFERFFDQEVYQFEYNEWNNSVGLGYLEALDKMGKDFVRAAELGGGMGLYLEGRGHHGRSERRSGTGHGSGSDDGGDRRFDGSGDDVGGKGAGRGDWECYDWGKTIFCF